MIVLVTGATGFVGSHLVEHLLAATDWQIVGVSRSLRHRQNIEGSDRRFELRMADLNEPGLIEQVVAEVRPDGVIHLAGQPLEPISWKEPAATFRMNVIGQINLFEAILKAGIRPRTVISGSALMYGLVKDEDNPIDEDQPLRPASPYAVSKIAADYLGYQYWVSRQLPVMRMRQFNQIGPKQSPDFALSGFARQIAVIETGKEPPLLRVGNLTAARDYTDVRDAVVAYRLALVKGQGGEAYNVGSGQAHVMESLLRRLLALSTTEIRVEPDPARFRPIDLPRIVCDASKLRRDTGWQPAISIEQSLAETLHYWRSEISRSQERN